MCGYSHLRNGVPHSSSFSVFRFRLDCHASLWSYLFSIVLFVEQAAFVYLQQSYAVLVNCQLFRFNECSVQFTFCQYFPCISRLIHALLGKSVWNKSLTQIVTGIKKTLSGWLSVQSRDSSKTFLCPWQTFHSFYCPAGCHTCICHTCSLLGQCHLLPEHFVQVENVLAHAY